MTVLRRLPPLVVAIVATAALMVGCGAQVGPAQVGPPAPSRTATQPPSQSVPSSPTAEPALPAPESTEATGSYVEYADYLADPGRFSSTDVVLFFHAPWCPSCRSTEDDIETRRSTLPAGLTLVKVDFDSHQDLRTTYGVTTQHTFVQIDADGAEILQWNGLTVDAIAAQIA